MSVNTILSLVSLDADGYVRVASRGNLTADDMRPAAKNPLESVLGANWSASRVLLDLSKTEYMDSSAIGWLIASARKFRSGGGALAVHSLRPRTRQMLDLLKIGRIVPTLPDEASARKFLSDPSPAMAA